MEIPASLSERFPFLDALEEDWEPVSRVAFYGWLSFYAVLIGNALLGGHLLFRMFGEWIMVAGGTFLQLFVPFALAANFTFRRQVPGTVFCAFFFFEQLLPISIYMADARAQELPLLTVGDSEDVIHDWFYLFSHTGLLTHDTQIASIFRFLGWVGMFATVGWFIYRSTRKA